MQLQAILAGLLGVNTPWIQGTLTTPTTTADLPRPTHYAYLLFPTFELIDVAGPLEVLTMLSWSQYPMQLSLISNDTLDPVSNDFKFLNNSRPFNNHTWSVPLVPSYTLDTAPFDIDILFVPGGYGTFPPLDVTEPYVDFIKARYPTLKYLFSVCTGAGLLARAGVLDGRNATTNKRSWASVTALGPKVNWIHQARWVVDGNIWTTSGVSAGIDGALGFVEAIYNTTVADSIAISMEYVRNANSSNDPFSGEQVHA